MLMLAIQAMQQILKDARMRDDADQIRTEVLNLGDDLGRLRERVLKLQNHFSQANEDVRQILVSADKIEKRAGRIEELDFSKEPAAETPRLVKPAAPELFPLPRKLQAGGEGRLLYLAPPFSGEGGFQAKLAIRVEGQRRL